MIIYKLSLKRILSQNGNYYRIYDIIFMPFFDTWALNVKNIDVNTFHNIATFIII